MERLQGFKPDIIHAHSTFAGGLVRARIGWRKNRPVIVYCPHGWVYETTRARSLAFLMKRCEQALGVFDDAVIAISNHERDIASAAGRSAEKLHTILNGIPLETRSGTDVQWQDERLKVLYVGRLDRQKGVDCLMRAVAPLTEAVCVRLVGAKILGGKIDWEVPENVESLGWCAPSLLPAHFRSADAVVIPSRWEGFGLVALEAMRAGKPVIASRVGGLKEVVVDGKTGLLVPPEDVEALRQAILSLLSPEHRSKMGLSGLKRLRSHFDVEETHRQVVSLYEGLARRRRALSALPPGAKQGAEQAAERG